MGKLEIKARDAKTCPKCGAEKTGGGVVCWGECWRGNSGLKYSKLCNEAWLEIYASEEFLKSN